MVVHNQFGTLGRCYRFTPRDWLLLRLCWYIRVVSTQLASLRSALVVMPPGTLVPRDWLLEQLSGEVAVQGEPSRSLVDLTIQDLAIMFGKRPSTVRAWVERGDFPGAYKLHGKQWRVPAGSVQEFQAHQSAGKRRL